MSGELDERPDLTALLRNLRDRVYELEHRISGDANPLSLNDLEDVRVDSLGDVTITLADGDALVYRAADDLWVPGSASGSGFPVGPYDDGTSTMSIEAGAPNWADGQVAIYNELDADSGTNIAIHALVATDYALTTINSQSTGEGELRVEGGDTYGDVALAVTDGGTNQAEIYVEAAGGTARYNADTGIGLFADEVIFHGMTAAADSGDLNATDFSFWLDPTPGAVVFHVKAKNSSGTVVNGSLALT